MHTVLVHPISEAFDPVLGLPSWDVKKGHGSFVTMQFGAPELRIEEPRSLPVFLGGAPTRTMIRSAQIYGQWYLWIYGCVWSLTLDTVELAHCESDDITMARALRVLNGQALTGIDVDEADGSSTFAFDLGCVLATHPARAEEPDDEPIGQWMLYQPSGQVLTVRGDGRYTSQAGSAPRDDSLWAPISIPSST